ncbi:MAG TPA: hypothetical protein VE665_04135 [Hyphomicrobiaceae bacterium]|nr:hypothetical protein [Hyphomicrobiaceae bacterium]
MTFAELRTRAEALDLRIRQIDVLRPPKVTIIQEVGGNYFAFLNDDGLPLFTIEEAAEVIDAIKDAGDYGAWLPTDEAREVCRGADAS